MRIAFAQVKDFSTRLDRGSGTWAFLCSELERQGHAVDHLHGEDVPIPLATRAAGTLARRLGRRYRSYQDPFIGRRIGEDLSRRLAARDPDLVLTNNVVISAYLATDRPVVLYTDAIFPYDYRQNIHPWLDDLAPYCVRFCQHITRLGLDRAALRVFPARWCLEEARLYLPDLDRFEVIPFGANLAEPPDAGCAERRSFAAVVAKKRLDLLFVGKDWKLKGGEIAVGVVADLEARGIAATLHVVGVDPADVADERYLVTHGFLDPTRPAERHRLSDLYRTCDALLLPTRCEGFGVTAVEAAAHGLPVLSYATRGISDAAVDGVTAVLVDPAAGPAAFANAIEAWFLNPAFYDKLVRGARRHFEENGRWSTVVQRLLEATRRLLR